MKKILAVAAALLAAFALFTACGSKTPSAGSKSRPTIRLHTDSSGITDRSFNAAAWSGILQFYGDTPDNMARRGSHYDFVLAPNADGRAPNLRQASTEGHDLIVVTGFAWADDLNQVAPQYPNQKFAIIDSDSVLHPNVLGFVFSEEEGSYLVGVAAALKAKEDGIANPRFGFIGGVQSATITKFEMGYIQGVRSVFPNAEIVDYYANSWIAPNLAKTTAKDWYDSGVYCIFSAAGTTGSGTIAQAKEYRMAGRNVWAIGVDIDQYEEGIYGGRNSSVLTSMLKRVDNAIIKALTDVENGVFEGSVVRMTLAEGGVDYAKSNPALSPSIIAEVDRAKQGIVSGRIRVYGTYREALAAGVAPAGLSALDN